MTMPKKTTAKYIREIKRLNARFRKLKKRNGLTAHLIATRKDALMDEMQAECRWHPVSFQTRDPSSNELKRICRVCGLVRLYSKTDYFGELSGGDAFVLEYDVYLVEQGKLLKRLGINL